MSAFKTALLLAAAIAPGALFAEDEPAAPDRWTVLAAPYLWAAALDGNAKVAGVQADVDVSFTDTLEDLSFSGMAIVEARKGRFGFAFNPLFVRTNSDARTGSLDAKNRPTSPPPDSAPSTGWPSGRSAARTVATR